ncbi:MAG TPA: TIGR00270 family protein [Methanophagales archaeon]|nr:TIGR00270 family protein [Methanophagales archaeon]
MTECEVCGAEIKGKAQYVVIGDSKLRVCKACAQFGTVVVEDRKVKAGRVVHAKSKLYEQMDHDIEVEVEEDYGRKLKEAREKVGIKQAELAKRINEKQSLLRKIENEEIVPSEEVMRKIARVLNF